MGPSLSINLFFSGVAERMKERGMLINQVTRIGFSMLLLLCQKVESWQQFIKFFHLVLTFGQYSPGAQQFMFQSRPQPESRFPIFPSTHTNLVFMSRKAVSPLAGERRSEANNLSLFQFPFGEQDSVVTLRYHGLSPVNRD